MSHADNAVISVVCQVCLYRVEQIMDKYRTVVATVRYLLWIRRHLYFTRVKNALIYSHSDIRTANDLNNCIAYTASAITNLYSHLSAPSQYYITLS